MRIPCDGGQSPNNFFPQVTVELKAFWPPFTVTTDAVLEVLEQAVAELRAEIGGLG